MGFSAFGVCYESDAQALAAFRATFPKADGGGLTTYAYLELEPGVGPGAVHYVFVRTDFLSAQAVSSEGLFQLPPCSDPGLAQFAGADVGLIVAIVVCWALGFSGGLRVQ